MKVMLDKMTEDKIIRGINIYEQLWFLFFVPKQEIIKKEIKKRGILFEYKK